ncbi:MAG TPA: hypothetical protein VEH84_11100, partial [Alphaproteobacteria bacterium]|nr:hypothetical protein [Alphaproteobacteria bacterium]
MGQAGGQPITTLPAVGSRLALQIVAIAPPGAQAGTLPAAPGLLPGFVAATPGGLPQVSTPLGSLVLPGAPPLPAGTQLVFAPADPALATAAGAAPPKAQPPFDPATARDWPALSTALDTLAALPPDEGGPAGGLATALPQPGPRLAATLALAMTAVRSGDLKALIGERPLLALERGGKRELLKRLSEDFAKLHAQAKAPPEEEWRSVTIPVAQEGGAVTPVHLFVRTPQPDRGGEDGPEGAGRPAGTRFVVEVAFSALGEVQLDGFAQTGRL